MSDTDETVCTCPLINVTCFGDREPQFCRGDPTGSGCPLHETIEMRLQLWKAEDRARYGKGETT